MRTANLEVLSGAAGAGTRLQSQRLWENADGPDLDPMNPGVVDDGGGGVEPHGLGIQQGTGELRRIAALEVGGGVGDMGKLAAWLSGKP